MDCGILFMAMSNKNGRMEKMFLFPLFISLRSVSLSFSITFHTTHQSIRKTPPQKPKTTLTNTATSNCVHNLRHPTLIDVTNTMCKEKILGNKRITLHHVQGNLSILAELIHTLCEKTPLKQEGLLFTTCQKILLF